MPVIARTLPGAAAVILVAGLVSGCASVAGTPVPQDVGTGSPTGSPSAAPTEAPEGSETPPAEVVPLPAGFPSEVPVPEAEVLAAHDLVDGWTVWFAAPDPVAGFDAAVALLTEAGFVEEVRSTGSGTAYGVYSTETHVVELTAGTGATHGAALALLVEPVPVDEDGATGG